MWKRFLEWRRNPPPSSGWVSWVFVIVLVLVVNFGATAILGSDRYWVGAILGGFVAGFGGRWFDSMAWRWRRRNSPVSK